jgi:two-component system, sensor histidine kinase
MITMKSNRKTRPKVSFLASRLGAFHYRTLQILSWVGLGILILIVVLPILSVSQYRQHRKHHVHSEKVLVLINQLKLAIVSAESNQRAFIISGKIQYSDIYHAQRSEAIEAAQSLLNETAGYPDQQEALKDLKSTIQKRFDLMEKYAQLQSRGDKKAMQAMVISQEGPSLAEKIDKIINTSEKLETQASLDREEKSEGAYDFAGTLIAIGVFASFLLLLMVTTMLKAQLVTRIRIEEELRVAQKNAAMASELKSSFLANMSHEIRTPLNGIIGMAKMLESTPLNEDQKEYLEVMKISSNSLLALINQILDFSKIESGKMQLEETTFELKSLIEGTVSIVDYAAKGKGLQILVNSDAEVPEFYIGDALRLRQVLLNLLNNAIKFSNSGEIKIFVKTVGTRESKVRLCFSIVDQGIGLSKDSRDRLFQAFTQGDSSTSRRFGGSGLGLAISKQIVELMGGKIGVESVEGVGSKFYFEVDLKISKFKEYDRSKDAEKTLAMSLGGKILVAEDNLVNQKVLGEMVKLMGCTYKIVKSGSEALAALQEESFDIVLMDGQMPEMDGYKAARLIRRGEAGSAAQKIPIIAITANAIKGDIEKCLAAGMNGYIGKPISYEDLAYKIEKWLARGYEVIDKAALQRVIQLGKESDPDLLKKLIEIFTQDTTAAIQNMKTKLNQSDFATVWSIAHTMKSSSANLGAIRLRDIYERIEKSKIDPHPEHLLLLVESAEREFEFAVDELKAMI